MIQIVFIGNGFHNRVRVLHTISDSRIVNINGLNEESIMSKLPTDVIDLFVIDRTKPLFKRIVNMIRSDVTISHIPIVSLVTRHDLSGNIINDDDVFVSEGVTDIEFKYIVKAMIRMKLMDDEIKKEKIILELNVKERTKELQGSEDRFKSMFNNMNNGIIIYKTNNNGKSFFLSGMNKKEEELEGVSEKEVLYKDLKEVVLPEIYGRYVQRIRNVWETGTPIKVPEIEYVGKFNRKYSWKSLFIYKIDTTDEVVVVCDDITNRKENEEKLVIANQRIEKSEQRFRELFERSSDSIMIAEDGSIIGCNCAAVTMLGFDDKKELIGMSLDDISSQDTNSQNETLRDMLDQSVRLGNHRFEWYYNKKHGETFPVEVLLTTIQNDAGKNIIHVVSRDITERIRNHKELLAAKEKAERSDRMKSIFISNVSHEIRTPMNSIIGFSSLLEKESNKKKVKMYIDIIINSGNLLLSLIDDIMDLSKIESGNLHIEKTKFDVQELFRELKTQFRLELKNRGKEHISLTISNKNHLTLYADKKRVNQVLNNLILNSIKFTEEGSITYGYTKDEHKVTFYVKDTGIGIKEEHIPLIFERFHQVNRERLKKQEGTGLGLTISKAIIELLGGRIWIESVFGSGTTVYFTIPIEPPPRNYEEPQFDKDSSYIAGSYGEKTVIVVEDNDTNYELLKILLMSNNMKVIRATDYSEFFSIIEETPSFDLILLDLQLPHHSGWEILSWMKENKSDVPVIIQSASVSHDNIEKAKKMGAYDFVTKPINAAELLDKIRSIYTRR